MSEKPKPQTKSIEQRLKDNIERVIEKRASAQALDANEPDGYPTMAWISEIYAHIRAIYEIELKLYNETKTTNELLKTVLGADRHVPTEELADRAEILGAVVNRLRNEADGGQRNEGE